MTEEKEAIEIIKSIININKENERTTAMLYVSDVDILLNLIEKLQKENGELKENERYMKDVFGEQICTLKVDKERFKRYGIQKEEEIKELKSNSILKDKIREKIKDLKLIDEYDAPNGWESERSYAEELLQELLEEE